MRIHIRTSRWAIWASRLASLALPLAVFSILLHRSEVISSAIFGVLLYIITALAVAMVFTTMIAFVRLWNMGHKGWGKTIRAFVLGIVLLVPQGYALSQANKYPRVNDVTTSGHGVPALALADNPHVIPIWTPEVLAYWPNAAPRTYKTDAETLFAIAELLVLEQGWEIRLRQPPLPEVFQAQIHALVTSWLGWRDEVSIAISQNAIGATIEMRSASFWAGHDLGVNGRRIETFLVAFDAAVADGQRNVGVEPQ